MCSAAKVGDMQCSDQERAAFAEALLQNLLLFVDAYTKIQLRIYHTKSSCHQRTASLRQFKQHCPIEVLQKHESNSEELSHHLIGLQEIAEMSNDQIGENLSTQMIKLQSLQLDCATEPSCQRHL